jgi:hypothetical protein
MSKKKMIVIGRDNKTTNIVSKKLKLKYKSGNPIIDGLNHYYNILGLPYWISIDYQTGTLIEWNVISGYLNKNILVDLIINVETTPITNDDVVVFDDDVLKEDWVSPWEPKIDKNHPPEGYRLVTEEEKTTMEKSDEYLFWFGPEHRWAQGLKIRISNWESTRIYAIPETTKLKPKVKELSVKEISELLGYEVKIVKD